MTSSKNVRWRRFASGLHQPLGLVVAEGQDLCPGPRPDHAAARLERRRRSRFLRVLFEQDDHVAGRARFHLRPGARQARPVLHGVGQAGADPHLGRRPAASKCWPPAFAIRMAWRLLPDGAVTVPCSEGEWTPASMICLVKPTTRAIAAALRLSAARKDGQPPALPLVYLPRGLDNSSGGQAVVERSAVRAAGRTDHSFFVRPGQPFSAPARRSRRPAARRDRAAARRIPLRRASRQGRTRATGSSMSPAWPAGAPTRPTTAASTACATRAQRVQLPQSLHVHENGVLISFVEPVDRAAVANLANHFAQVWNYRYSPGYGSPEFAPSHPGVVGHEALEIAGVHVVDERTVFVEMPDLQPVNQLHLVLQVDAGPAAGAVRHGAPARSAVHASFPAISRATKTDRGASAAGRSGPARQDDAQSVGQDGPAAGDGELGNRGGQESDVSRRGSLRVKAGERVQLTFTNPDVVPHNWVLVKPGSLVDRRRPGEQADRRSRSRAAALRAQDRRRARLYRHRAAAAVVHDLVRRAREKGPLSVSLHVPRALDGDERRAGGGVIRYHSPALAALPMQNRCFSPRMKTCPWLMAGEA